MTDRDILLKIVAKAKKKTKEAKSDIERNMIFVDELLANGVIVPPCKVGDMVYIIDDFDTDEPFVLDVEVVELGQSNRGKWITLDLPLGLKLKRYISWSNIGKTLFLTKEEAEKALAERK